ncbi:MAG: diphthine--ammonia ligase [archaeon]
MKKACVLFSGGKDSALALFKASKKYKIEFLLNMVPENKDSFMFHKPELKLLKKQAEMLGIKLVIGKTKGEKEKELKDLKRLIEKVKDKVEVIVIGGLASNYQGDRINKIASELGLDVYAPLWDYSAEELWNELLGEGFEVVLTKIACEGIPLAYLGRVIDELVLEDLKKLAKTYKFRLDFEGGEAESVVLFMPGFKKRIKIRYDIESEDKYRHFIKNLEIKEVE